MTITSTEKTTTVVYGLGPIAEQTDEWNYVLNDGVNVPRQLTSPTGEITMAVRYNPWGKPIETNGIGNFDASYIGTLIDATTGLIYVGNGQYYDPETGRFLTRGVNPNGTNPYVPWNPIGMMLGPLALISSGYAKKKIKHTQWLILTIMALTLMSCFYIEGCQWWNDAWNVSPPDSPTGVSVGESGETVTPDPVTQQAPVVEEPTEVESSCDYCAAWAGGQGVYNRDEAVRFARDNKVDYQDTNIKSYQPTDCTNFVSYALRVGGLLESSTWYPNSTAWVNTQAFYDYIKGVGFSSYTTFSSTANYYDKRTDNNSEMLYLREHNEETAAQQPNTITQYWSDFMVSIQNAKPGDLVFYKDPTEYSEGWTHVGIITEYPTDPTHYSLTKTFGNEVDEYRIIDHSGKTSTEDTLPRSIGDTNSEFNFEVMVVYGP